MTEVVTSSAALSQLSLLASRQQVFSVERFSSLGGASSTDASPTPTLASHQIAPLSETAGHHESADQKQADQSAKNNSGPSRARIEIRSLDIGLTPAEVVGTPDVLQRFDTNGDGRVDLLESERASLVREKGTTFAAVGGAPIHVQSEAAAPAAVPVPAPSPAPEVVNLPGVSKKLFTPAEVAEVAAPKKLYADVVAQGAAAGGVDVPKKFYGQGAEVIVGQAAVAAAPAAPAKISEKVVVQDRVVTEAGTGETKLYDKVAQTETDQGQSQTSGEGTLYDKAQQVAVATNGTKKTVVVEVNAYAAVAATTDTSAPVATTTVVTA